MMFGWLVSWCWKVSHEAESVGLQCGESDMLCLWRFHTEQQPEEQHRLSSSPSRLLTD